MRILRALVTAAIAVSLLATIPAASGNESSRSRATSKRLPALTGARSDALTRALSSGDLSEAEYALERAKSLFHLRSVRSRFGAVARPGGRDATLILRDLAIRAKDLSGDDRTEAEALLARPDDSQGEAYGKPYKDGATITVICGTGSVELCVHYVPVGGGDSFNETDPAFAASTLAEMTTVWNTEITNFGFRQPRGDNSSDNNGGDDRTDVYLANIGEDFVYGYCNTDDPEIFDFNGRHNVSAYCVLDNDYSHEEFPNLGPLENMQVTAAHEFFHAIQFAYDAYDDSWFLEGNAAWMEDEVYDDVNDNYQYLASSPATMPSKAVDFTNNGSAFINRYGSWYFWRFLTEYFSDTPQVTDPSVIRRMWEKADAAGSAPDMYSMQAASSVIAEEGSSMKSAYATFAATAFVPETFFEEGQGYLDYLATDPKGPLFNPADGGRPKLSLKKTLSAANPSGSTTVEIDHMASSYMGFTPDGSLPDTSMLKLKVNGPDKSHGTMATALVIHADDTVEMTTLPLTKEGNGTLTLAFGPTTVARVILVASNASTKYKNCGGFTFYSCAGKPKFDDQEFVVKGTLQ